MRSLRGRCAALPLLGQKRSGDGTGKENGKQGKIRKKSKGGKYSGSSW